MATTPTPISAANTPFHPRLRPPSSPSLVAKFSNPLYINGIITKNSKVSKSNGVLRNGLLNRYVLDKATQRVESANKELTEIEKQENKTVYINQLETRVSKIAELEKQQQMTESKTVNINEEKLESIKAASISAVVGTLASLPISLTHFTNSHQLTVSTSIAIITCALYGATYRYTIRKDLNDFHLKNGTSAAFGIVKGVATLEGRPSLDAFSGVVCVSENVLIFLLAAAGLDFCYKMGILSPFPLERSVSRTKM
uniref:uncharacterized protein LOC122579403 n=1 Tax=Erigeron canadensis TaxID=72917 RepID=UPI001CB8E52D|nr:uncharacterized protein LOC122579403 [Erigeron canadensis]